MWNSSFRFSLAFCFIVTIAACSTTSNIKQETLWLDEQFQTPTLKLPTEDELFRLPSDLENLIRNAHLDNAPIQKRADFLLQLLYTNESRPFLYEGYHSTTATETWERNRGDCLSLSILAYAVGQRLKLPITIQEVPMPVNFDRQGKVEYSNGHVNAIILHPSLTLSGKESQFGQGFMLIDFDPGQFTQRRGKALSRREVLSHYYNNLGVEAMLRNQKDLAYAYFKTSLQQFPSHVGSHNNLAALYYRNGQSKKATEVLEVALMYDEESLLTLRQLKSIYSMSEPTKDLNAINRRIAALQEQDPYYWVGRGLSEFENKNYHNAIVALERAEKFTAGFEEVHQALAIAYLQTNNIQAAKRQLELLSQINRDNPKLRYIKSRVASN